MADFSFQDFAFECKEDMLKVSFLKLYEFSIQKKDLDKIGKWRVDKNTIFFEAEQSKAQKAFMRILNKEMTHLTNKISKNPTLYIHKNSAIPLMGSLNFGIVDKGSDLLEIKPLTSCNADCTFCSVDEGPSSKKKLDMVIEKDYLVDEVKKLLSFKKEKVHIYINPQGEPLLYADIVGLVADLSKLEYVKATTIITNATLLTQELADKLIDAGLTSFNVSFHAIDAQKAKDLFHMRAYNVERVKDILVKIKNKVQIILAPVVLKGVNEQEMEKIASFCDENGFLFGMQNFLHNKRGRNPVSEQSFEWFFDILEPIEEKYPKVVMKLGKIGKTKELAKPFRKGEVVQAEIFSEGRYPYEILAKAQGRVITLSGKTAKNRINITITRDAHNIFYAEL